jgi:hypothetical protein
MTTTNQRAVELAPCPFCGTAARAIGNERAGYFAACPKPHCFATMGDSYNSQGEAEHCFPTQEAAIAAWNRRAPGWRPISEAPRDGTVVFFHVPGNTNLLYGRADDYWHGLDALKNATHFHELPLPPPPGE